MRLERRHVGIEGVIAVDALEVRADGKHARASWTLTRRASATVSRSWNGTSRRVSSPFLPTVTSSHWNSPGGSHSARIPSVTPCGAPVRSSQTSAAPVGSTGVRRTRRGKLLNGMLQS